MWAFPVECDENGRLKEVTGDDVIRQSIRMILTTAVGERYYHRDFGVGLNHFVFGIINYTTLQQIERQVREAITEWEKRVKLVNVEVKGHSSKIHISVAYEFENREYNFTHSLDMRG